MHNDPILPAQPDRRDFLRNTLALGAGAAVAVAAAPALAVTEPDAAPAPLAQQGYHVTPHIHDYYRTAAL